jgi:hypothetical protein
VPLSCGPGHISSHLVASGDLDSQLGHWRPQGIWIQNYFGLCCLFMTHYKIIFFNIIKFSNLDGLLYHVWNLILKFTSILSVFS